LAETFPRKQPNALVFDYPAVYAFVRPSFLITTGKDLHRRDIFSKKLLDIGAVRGFPPTHPPKQPNFLAALAAPCFTNRYGGFFILWGGNHAGCFHSLKVHGIVFIRLPASDTTRFIFPSISFFFLIIFFP
jgi:hypothetical protein